MKTTVLQSDENLLLAELKSGNKIAFKHFYDKYHLPLYRKLLKLVQAEVIAEELLQDLFMKIWQKRELIDPEQSFKAYLYRIAERIVSDHYRKLAREVKLEREINITSIDIYEASKEDAQVEFAQKIINEAIDTLPSQQKIVFRMCKIDGKSYEEVSKLLNISHATINTHISRASKSVKEYVLKNYGNIIVLAIAFAILGVARQMI